jgi:hypothetical protein
MKFLARLAAIGIVILIALQAIRPGIATAPATAELQAPPQIKHILEKDCYACHSNERRLAWFDQIVPGYWLVRHDILTAREHLNFSTIGAKPAAAQRATLFEAVNMIQLGAMPLPQFTPQGLPRTLGNTPSRAFANNSHLHRSHLPLRSPTGMERPRLRSHL